MKKTMSFILVLAALPSLAFASSSANTPITKTAVVSGISALAVMPTYISIKSMANPAIKYTINNAALGVSVTGSAQTQDEIGLDALLSSSTVTLTDGGLEIDVRSQGMYECSISSINSRITSISGECLSTVQVNFQGMKIIPIYLNGQFIPLTN
jgi:hypothetical protein